MGTLIGLTLRVRLMRALPERYKVDIRIHAGTHQSEHARKSGVCGQDRCWDRLDRKVR